MTASHAIARWRAADDLLWTQYDDSSDWVVYNPASGDIHLVSDAAHRLWELTCGEMPVTAEQLVAALVEERGTPSTPEFISAARESLAFMDRAGLVRLVSA